MEPLADLRSTQQFAAKAGADKHERLARSLIARWQQLETMPQELCTQLQSELANSPWIAEAKSLLEEALVALLERPLVSVHQDSHLLNVLKRDQCLAKVLYFVKVLGAMQGAQKEFLMGIFGRLARRPQGTSTVNLWAPCKAHKRNFYRKPQGVLQGALQ